MSSSFTGPIRIYKYNNSTNDGTIAPDNTGAAQVSQQQFIAPITATTAAGDIPTFKLGQTTATPLVIPAGSIISDIKFYESNAPTALTGGVVTVNIDIPDPVTGVITTTALGTITPNTTGGILSIVLNAGNTVARDMTNVGPMDVTLRFTATAITAITGDLEGTFSVEYTARNPDGSITPQGQGYTNN